MKNDLSAVIETKVIEWNAICHEMCAGLFIADAFVPKPVPTDASNEIRFWYDITNINSLFMDCMQYVFKTEKMKYFRSPYELTKNGEPSSSLLKIMQDYQIISSEKRKTIEKFVRAIKELRSCFCHNKPWITHELVTIENGIGRHSQQWGVFPHLSSNQRVAFSYYEGSRILWSKTNSIVGIIDSLISDVADSKDSEEIYYHWAKSIASWYFSSDDIIHRSLIRYYMQRYNRRRPLYRDLNDLKLKLEIDGLPDNVISEKTGLSNEDINKAILEHHLSQATDEILSYNKAANPEYILGLFFNSVL